MIFRFGFKVFLTVLAISISGIVAAENLMQDPTVQAAGTYTYFSRGDAGGSAVVPFSKAFFPGGSDTGRGLHANDPKGPAGRDGKRIDTGGNAGPVSIGRGELTDGSTKGGVFGFIGVVSPDDKKGKEIGGTFDILFDLGAVYEISEIRVFQQDAAGFRWRDFGNVPDAQKVLIAEALANPAQPADSDFSEFATATFAKNSGPGFVEFEGRKTEARYVVLRVATGVWEKPGEKIGAIGGRLAEVEVIGSISK